MKAILAVVTAVVLVGAATADDKKIDPAKLVGKWKLVKSDAENAPMNALVEFTKDKKLTISLMVDGTPLVIKGTYTVDGDKLKVKLTPPEGGKEEEESDTIKSLTDDKVVLVDTKGKVTEMARTK